MTTAKEMGLARCHHCGQLSELIDTAPDQQALCPCCHGELHFRQPRSLQRTWAFSLAAVVMLIPANVLPILTVIHFGKGEPDTIMSGIIDLWQSGLWVISAIVFIASIVVPVIKLLAIVLLLLVVHWRLPLNKAQCILLYRFVHFIGRWSMLDLFMISILVTLVHLGNIANVESGPGATAFGAVVVLTIFAANSFDPRLIWDLEHE
jgi:paraquat-inducible protein A